MIFQGSSTGTLTGNTISFNRATQVGGGMTIYDQTSPTLRYNRFEGNQANDGAAIQIEQNAAPLVENNDFIGNVASRYGGGIVVNHQRHTRPSASTASCATRRSSAAAAS